jgi:hypothetical protein
MRKASHGKRTSVRTILSTVVCATITLSYCATARAQLAPAAQGAWSSGNGYLTGVSLTHDNDLIYELGTRRQNYDRNYTGAFSLTLYGDGVHQLHLDMPLRAINRLLGARALRALRDSTRTHFYSVSLLGSGFTPDSLNTPDPIPNDRPYSSLIGVSVRRVSVSPKDYKSALTTELVVGMLGLNGAKAIQTKIHELLRDPPQKPEPYLPEGWHNQISHGGEPTALYRVGWNHFLFGDAPQPKSQKHFQAAAGLAGTIGYYTTLAADMGFRLGTFQSEFWEYTSSTTSTANQNLGQNGHRGSRMEYFLYSNIRPRATIYNALLQGQFRQTRLRISSRNIERLQIEYELGAALFFPLRGSGISLNWVPLVGRGRDTKLERYSQHRWGSATIGVSLNLP